MQVGVNILNFGPGVGADALGRWARLAEDLGYHSIMISDHVAMTPDVRQRYPEPFYDPFTTLAWMAGQTTRVHLGTTVCVLPYRHPILMARLAANIDTLSGGRFIFGVGVGNPNSRLEAEAMGVPFHRRGAVADEYLAAIKALWTRDQASFQGTFVSFTDVSRIRGVGTGPTAPAHLGRRRVGRGHPARGPLRRRVASQPLRGVVAAPGRDPAPGARRRRVGPAGARPLSSPAIPDHRLARQ